MARILKLENRGVIRLSGRDTRTLLQGLVTNDVNQATGGNAVYAGLLTPQGKFLFDMIIICEGDDLLLDVEASRKADLIRRLMMYRLRADVEITDEPASVWALFDGTASDGISYDDPRHKSLHQRVICVENPAPDADLLEFETYEERRIRHGVPDGSHDMAIEKNFWLETNAEQLNGVSFSKGCFVGQELTARMKHRTTLKKMLVPVVAESGKLAPGSAVLTEAGKTAGDLRTTAGSYGLAFMRLEYLQEPLFVDSVPVNPLANQKISNTAKH